MPTSDRASEVFHFKRPLHLRPCLLLLIGEASAHGYDLLERLTAFGFERDPGGLYRTLRAMEHEGLVRSEWEISSNGPGRRRYELTPPGRERLQAEAACLLETGRMVEAYLRRYGILEHRATPTRT
jgi:DNA-binding PadR family transcriptional regulator